MDELQRLLSDMMSNEERLSKSLNEGREAYFKRLKERLDARKRRDEGEIFFLGKMYEFSYKF